MEISNIAVVGALGALAQAHRLATFRALVKAGEAGLAAGEIANRLNMPPSTLSFHLAQLEKAGLVEATRRGRSLIYAAKFELMAALIAYLSAECCGGDVCAVVPLDQSKEKHA